jgi:hypothetical protein
MLLAAQTGLVIGTLSESIALNAPTAGTVQVTLADLAWPIKLDSLSFSATSDTGVLASVSLSDFTTYQTTFSLTGAGAFYAHLTGQAQGLGIPGLPGIGLYSMQIGFSPLQAPVPLPASLWLFLIGLGGTIGMGLLCADSRRPLAALLPAPEH